MLVQRKAPPTRSPVKLVSILSVRFYFSSLKKGETTIETKKMSVAIIYGVTSIFIFAIAASFIFSILLRFTALTESSLSLVMMIVTFFSLFIGGFISGGKGKKQGIVL